MTEKEKMLAGEFFLPFDQELVEDRNRATRLMHRLNVELCNHDERYRETLHALCPNASDKSMIRAPFHCDYGYNIYLGEGTFVNFDCVFLDLTPIRIGCRCLIGPNVQLLTANHPFDATTRASGIETGLPITLGDDCWIGGGVIVCPGVTIGSRSIVGAGSVVTRDIPDDTVAAGNPARIIRTLPKN